MKIAAILLVSLSLLVPVNLAAEQAAMSFQREAVGAKSFPAAPRIVQLMQLEPATILSPAIEAVPEEIEAVRTWNAEGRLPARNGIVRSLGERFAVSFGGPVVKSGLHGRGAVAATANGTTWGASFRVREAKRLRLQLKDVELPPTATLWVYGASGEAIGFDTSGMGEDKTLWTPSVEGDTVYLEVEVPAGSAASFNIEKVLELLHSRKQGFRPENSEQPTCLVGQDVVCQGSNEFPAMNLAKAAVGQMDFVVGDKAFICSGTLIADQQGSNTPYFLTANHCISSQTVATTVETYFDFVWTSCDWNDWTYHPAVRGSTLLKTSATSDVTLLRLPSLPANRTFLGWDTQPPANGAVLHRISHPKPLVVDFQFPQMYSRTIVSTTSAACSGARPNFIYSNESNGGEGGVYGGSSGSSVILSNGPSDARIVGQLLGSCGCPDPRLACDRTCSTVDGAFSQSFDLLRPHLAGGSTPGTPQPCSPNASTICLVNDRFSVRVTYDVGNGPQPMTAIKYTPESGLFWFANASNIEVLLKMINACSFNNRFWVYSGGTTDVGVTITVTDSKTGTVKTYNNPRGTKFGTITDGDAFATCP